MTKEEIISRILEIIAEVAPDDDLSNVDPDIPLREQLSLDSMDFLDIVMELLKRYNIEIPEEDYPELSTLNKCVNYLGSKFE